MDDEDVIHILLDAEPMFYRSARAAHNGHTYSLGYYKTEHEAATVVHHFLLKYKTHYNPKRSLL